MVRKRVEGNPELMLTVDGLETYTDDEQRKFIHLVDGGITDNLGLRAIYEIIELNGGMNNYLRKYKRKPPSRMVLISLNAITNAASVMDQTTQQPSVAEAVNAMSDVQLKRYSAATIELINNSLKRWAEDASTPEHKVEPYFIQLNFDGIQQVNTRKLLNQTPTSFYLTDEQVDRLIEVGGELLRTNPEFRRLMANMAADSQ